MLGEHAGERVRGRAGRVADDDAYGAVLRGSRGDSWQIVRVSRGQTLGSLFEDFDIPAATLHKVLEQPGAKAALTRLKPGTELAFDLPVNGELRTFRYDRDDSHRVELSFNGDTITEKVIVRPVETKTVVLSGEVGSSLFRSARKLGLSGSNINTLSPTLSLGATTAGGTVRFDPGPYDIVLTRAGTDNVVFGPRTVDLAGNGIYTIVATGTSTLTAADAVLLDDFAN